MSFRIDKDSLGEFKVPKNAYYGPFTARALEQYKVTGHKSHLNLIKAYVMIKRSAALTNYELQVLDERIAKVIIQACDEILSGQFLDQFVIDAINSGAGTAVNMNTNEIIANRALELLGKSKGDYSIISPNDHVNMSQSSNDTFPTAMHIAILMNINLLIKSLGVLIKSLKIKSIDFKNIIKIGRTHLMDAIPVTLGSEFKVYAYALERAKEEIINSQRKLEYIGIGATAVGTGINTPNGYREKIVNHLSHISGLNLKMSANLHFFLQSKLDITNFSSELRNLAIELIKMVNDLRLMASGPIAGLAEILIPAVHAGSSIMPGKVNPSLAECLNMICFDIIGKDVSITMAAQAGQFELNVMLPGMLNNVLDATDMLINFLPIFATNFINGIQANSERLKQQVEKSPILITLLNPYIGYLTAAEIYKESLSTGIGIRELILGKNLMSEKELEDALSYERIIGLV
ncbi:MAG TPA: aspartate ammonia-lyase [Nitrososphaeraceae archaeon]|nr:aspartate ammonia-lyase [Nitrososphaeraceae archaeon]